VLICASCGAENREGARFCDSCGVPLAAEQSRESRKTVTVLFCDVTGSTALGEQIDPESLRNVMARYFETAKGAIERHGGTVEKFIGDAVMAVFGVPVVHEDDALRAVRAADELRVELAALNDELEQRFGTRVQVRIGVNTGEVVTGTEERLATGDAVNVAARLEQAARPGEILLGEETERLVRGLAELEAADAIAAKGKSAPVRTFRLVNVDQEHAAAWTHGAPMVGRERQRHLLEEALANVVADRACHLFTVLGTAGVGKSRLVAEFLGGLDGVTVVSGRCLSYGDGISYFPVTEVAIQLGARANEHPGLAPILDEDAPPSSPEEIAWAFRKLLEARAVERPLVVVFDDIHWGEPAFLELVEHVADFSRDAPILLLCMARPDLLDKRTAWGGGKLNASNVLLEPLPADDADELLTALAPGGLDAGLRARILEAADGNPLFVEEMVAMVGERKADRDGGAEIDVPPTIQALLAARLDQLDAHERVVLERGAVEGLTFHRGVVEALAPEEREVTRRLMSLVRKELVRPDRPLLSGDDAFRFRHLLIRDAAYDSLPKAERATLHQSFAAWLQQHGRDLVELDEIVGYHLEQAWRYRNELGAPADPELRAAAHERLETAARRALRRNDLLATINLLERALALVPVGEIDLQLEIDLFRAHYHRGEPLVAGALADALAERAATAGDRAAELGALLHRAEVDISVDPEGAAARIDRLSADALAELGPAGDDLTLYLVYEARALVAHLRGLSDTQLEAARKCVEHARRLESPNYEYWILPSVGAALMHGSTPLSEVLAWVDNREDSGFTHPSLKLMRASGLGLLGRTDEARTLIAAIEADLAERGDSLPLAIAIGTRADIESFAGDVAAAIEQEERGIAMWEKIGDRSFRSTSVANVANHHYELGALEAAWTAATEAAALGASDDVATQTASRLVKAKVLARKGDFAEAERLARESVALAETVELAQLRGSAYDDLAEVLQLAGKRAEATAALERALDVYERKEAVALADRVRRRLENLLSAG
jgi:class 3 adenylate cyclase/tetratricopeptide (TPR) repeat protein